MFVKVDTSGEDAEEKAVLEFCIKSGSTQCNWKQFGADVVRLTKEELSCAEKSSAQNWNDVHGNENNVHSFEKRKVAHRTRVK